jgi:hypothetical protein
MLIPFGVLSAAGAGEPVALSDYELITSTILTTTAASVEFSSLGTYSSTYKHLQIRASARSNSAGVSDVNWFMRINGDTGSNYARHLLRGTGTSVSSSALTSATSMRIGSLPAATGTTSEFGPLVLDLLDPYSTTKNKTVRCLTGLIGSQNRIELQSNFRISTASTTSITLLQESGSFIAGSRFSLYGIKG